MLLYKKKLSDFGPPPPLRIPGHAPGYSGYNRIIFYETPKIGQLFVVLYPEYIIIL